MSLLETLTEKTAPLAAPIAGASPGGADITFDPDFEKVKGEIDKLSNVSGNPPAWREIEDTGARLLKEKGKDMRIATWMTVAKMNRAGWEGFAEGLLILKGLVSQHWDVMFPEAKRGRARANLITWLIDQSSNFFEKKDVTAAEGEAIKLTDDTLKEIDNVLGEKLGDLYGGLGKLRGTMRDKIRAIPAEAAPAAPAPATPEPSAAAAAPAPAPPPPPAPSAPAAPEIPAATNAEDAANSLRAAGRAIIDIAKVLRKADPAQAFSYRVHRAGLWLSVKQPPPAEGGKTRLPPPPGDQKKRVNALLEQQKWLDLLNAAEDTSGNFLFWFELHRLTATAMDRLGALFMEAREVVGRDVVAFLDRYPAFDKLQFSDGSPFLDPATKSWVDDERKKYGGGGGGGGGPSAASAEDEELAKRFEEAKGLVTSGKPAEGLALAVQLAVRGADARTRFRARLNVAQLALDGAKPEVAKPMLEGLLGEIEAHKLEDWEPSLCIPTYANLLTCLRAARTGAKTPPNAEALAREAFLFDKLARLDPARALGLGT